MSRLTNDEMADRIVNSLRANSAALAREQSVLGNAKVGQLGMLCVAFAVGIVAGAALVLAL